MGVFKRTPTTKTNRGIGNMIHLWVFFITLGLITFANQIYWSF